MARQRARLPWDDWPPIPYPDQSRYGLPPTGDRVGKWRIAGFNDEQSTLLETVVIGDPELDEMLADLEQRPDFGGAVVMPLPRPRRPHGWGSDTPDSAGA